MSIFTERRLEITTAKSENKNKILVIDADTLVYSSCCTHEFCIDEDNRQDEDAWDIDLEDTKEDIESKIILMLEQTGCKEAELHFSITNKDKNFRYLIYPEYKANRKTTRYPAGLKQLKEYFGSKPGNMIHDAWEADDYVVWRCKQPNTVLAAVDKDVLNSLEGTHWNYYSNEKYNIKAKWHTVDKKTAIQWTYIQTLMGDSTDNIKGLSRVGLKTAQKILGNSESHCDLWNKVKEAYLEKDREIDEAILNARLVSMHQLVSNDKGQLILKLFEEHQC